MRLRTAHLVAVVCLAACAEDYGVGFGGRGQRGSGGVGSEASPIEPAPVHGSADFPRSASCGKCHQEITKQWSTSMHARASTSITTVVQTNLVAAQKLFGEGPRAMFCVNCHAPVQAAVAGDATLPVKAAAAADLDDGVSCGACHQYGRTPSSGAGGVASDFTNALSRGPTFFGPIADPITVEGGHGSTGRDTFGDQGALCGNCHDVNLDRDGDARIHAVKDLVLQTTQGEYDAYRQTATNPKTCAECHMPVLAGVTRAADGVPGAPLRKVHDHSFVGVDHALDGSPDPQAPARQALLAGAAKLTVDSQAGIVSVSVTNTGAGHSLPSGFAFARQMWIELVVDDGAGKLLFASGAVANPRADLCDDETLAGPLAKHVEGCATADPLLASFQQKLVDRVVPKLGGDGPTLDARGELIAVAVDPNNEVVLQHLEGGAVPRVRQADGLAVKPLVPGETRVFQYDLLGRIAGAVNARVTARLLFRALPPYFVRALMEGHPGKNTALDSLDIVEMAKASTIAN